MVSAMLVFSSCFLYVYGEGRHGQVHHQDELPDLGSFATVHAYALEPITYVRAHPLMQYAAEIGVAQHNIWQDRGIRMSVL